MAILPHIVSAEIGGKSYEFHPLEMGDYFELGDIMRQRASIEANRRLNGLEQEQFDRLYAEREKEIDKICPFTNEYIEASKELEAIVYRTYLQLKKVRTYKDLFPDVIEHLPEFLAHMNNSNGKRDDAPVDKKKSSHRRANSF